MVMIDKMTNSFASRPQEGNAVGVDWDMIDTLMMIYLTYGLVWGAHENKDMWYLWVIVFTLPIIHSNFW